MHNCRALGKSPSFAHVYKGNESKFRQRVGHLHVHLSDDFALFDLIRMAWWVTKNCEFHRGGARISGKGAHIYKGLGVRFADFISFSLIFH